MGCLLKGVCGGGTATVVVVRIVMTCGTADDGPVGCCKLVVLVLAGLLDGRVALIEVEVEDDGLDEELETVEVEIDDDDDGMAGEGGGFDEEVELLEVVVGDDLGGATDDDDEVEVLLVVRLVGGQRL